jgi:hypothetical protein
MNAQLAAAVVHTFKHPMGPRCKAAQVPAAVLILQAEPDAFHNAVKLIARTALVDLLELRQRRLGASN